MTNEDGLLQMRIELMLAGEIGSTGNMIEYGGTTVKEPEELLTRTAWKKRNRKVKDGEEGYKYKIWVPRKNQGDFYHKNVFFFKESQTEEI